MTQPRDLENQTTQPNRREFLTSVSGSIFGAALATLLDRDASGSETASGEHAPRRVDDLKPRPTHHRPSATGMIHLFMNGGPSQMDLFDPKPLLDKHHGEPYFDKIAGEVENPAQAGALFRSPFKFARHGKSGMWVSDAMPHLAGCVDDISVIRSMFTTNLTHEPALYKIHSGRMLTGQPTLGAWITYALGSVNQNLPAYVVLDDPGGLPINRSQNWQAGYLSPVYQGTRFRSTGSPVLNLKRDFDEPDVITRAERSLISQLDQLHRQQRSGQPQLDARIASYELAARMQLAATDALDLTRETAETKALYGIGKEPTDSYGRRCLIARRLIERGVRFVQLFIDNQIWDNHTNIASGLKKACDRTDRPIAGLLTDLKRRGLLDETLVAWGGEFGRLPIAQLPGEKSDRTAGRDHNKNAMCSWMAGGGVRGGLAFGETDELGFAAVENKVSVPDWHATVLHLLGMDHQKLFYSRNGLEEKLTSVFECRVVKEILS
jgi:hypothetical protein